MKIKKDDKVIIIKGKDRGKTGTVLGIDKKKGDRVLVEGINIVKKHIRSRDKNQKGQRVEIEMPFNVSNIKIICPKCNKSARVGYKIIKGEKDNKKKKVRICKQCQQEI